MKRFSLRALFVVSTLAVLFFGYAQWRRQRLLREVHSLESEGVQFSLPQSWWTTIWLQMPRGVQLNAKEAEEGKLSVGSVAYTLPEADERVRVLRKRVRAMGVGYFLVDLRMKGGARHQLAFDLKQIEEANDKYTLAAAVQRPKQSVEEMRKLIQEQAAKRMAKPMAAGK